MFWTAAPPFPVYVIPPTVFCSSTIMIYILNLQKQHPRPFEKFLNPTMTFQNIFMIWQNMNSMCHVSIITTRCNSKVKGNMYVFLFLKCWLIIRPHLKMWAYYAIPLSSVRLSICPSVPLTLSLQLLLNPLRDFDETWYKERSHCVDVHIIRGPLSHHFQRSYSPWT
jgi:hypothetical protein